MQHTIVINGPFYNVNCLQDSAEIHAPLDEESHKTNFKKCCLQLFTGITHNTVKSELGIQEELRALDTISDFHFLGVEPDFSSLWLSPLSDGILGLFPHRWWGRRNDPGM